VIAPLAVPLRNGGEKAFRELVAAADEHGIKIILDGVFNHTGDNSKYFDRYGTYGGEGAYSNKDSKYFKWFNFKDYPDSYECWWNIDILPRVKCDEASYRDYICGENGIIRKYIEMDAAGWRLDVADELSDEFIRDVRKSAKTAKSDAYIIGEVWEDASNKISYGKRRKYLLGDELDGVMNYVLRNAIVEFVLHSDAERIASIMTEQYYNYPKSVSDVLMNLLGTHDTARILTELGAIYPDGAKNSELARFNLTANQRLKAKQRLKCAWLICSTAPGVPCIYYGDEAGMEGWGDPFCRRPYPWGNEDHELIDFYRSVGELRKKYNVYIDGIFQVEYARDGVLIFSRSKGKQKLFTAVNAGQNVYSLDSLSVDAITGSKFTELLPGEARVFYH